MTQHCNLFDALQKNETEEIIEFLLKSATSKELSSDPFWAATTKAFKELNSTNICSIGFNKSHLSYPSNINSKISEWVLKISDASNLGTDLLYNICKLDTKYNLINGVVINNPNLSAILIFSSLLLDNIKTISRGNLIISININNDGSQNFGIHKDQLYWPESLIRNRLHLVGFKRIRRLDTLEKYTTIKCEKNIFRSDDGKKSINGRANYNASSNYITTALVCDKGISI